MLALLKAKINMIHCKIMAKRARQTSKPLPVGIWGGRNQVCAEGLGEVLSPGNGYSKNKEQDALEVRCATFYTPPHPKKPKKEL